ncbi:hypothetical protein SORBI_3001G487250 [Sorghum bicolor]|jgi:hypothetical protein|uniref:Uncharacterized protein n=1 Tax=Sorghum bicolor TaxID=4558 RepID=A0A1Z5SB45_SORBI|nr:hypothetical protein SORBI_3001G487250 [Sorghum bicolor]
MVETSNNWGVCSLISIMSKVVYFTTKNLTKRQQMEPNQITAVTDGNTLQNFSCQTPWERTKNAFIVHIDRDIRVARLYNHTYLFTVPLRKETSMGVLFSHNAI